MKIEINAQPVFWFNLTKEQIDLISSTALSHYDDYCRSVAKINGFVFGWRGRIYFDESLKLSASFRQIDTVLKILEFVGYTQSEKVDVAKNLSNSFRAALLTANREIGHLSITVESE